MKKNTRATDAWRQFVAFCACSKTEAQLSEIFDFFLTPEEKIDIGKRISLIKELLDKNLSQRAISKKVGVSISKVTRGSNCLKRVPSQFLNDLKKL